MIKINTKYFTKEGDLEDLNNSTIPILPNDEPEFPRGKNPFVKRRGQEEEKWEYVKREFYRGHRYKVLCFGFIQNNSQLVSLDTKGYIYLWAYDRNSFTSELHFKPTEKLKLDSSYTRLIPESTNRIFPGPKDKEINPKTKKLNKKVIQAIGEFQSTINIPDIQENATENFYNEIDQTTVFLINQGDEIPKYGVCNFLEYTFNDKGMVIKAAEVQYQAQSDQCAIIDAKLTKDKQYMVIHLLKNHPFSIKGSEMHEFVVLNLVSKRLNAMKTALYYPKNTELSYEVSNIIPPYNIPYLYVLHGFYVLVISLISGQIVGRLDYTPLVSKNIKKNITFDLISSSAFNSIYVSSIKFDSMLLVKLDNKMSVEEMDSFARYIAAMTVAWN